MLFYSLVTVCCLSFLFNLLLLWYTRNLIRYLALFTEDSREVLVSIQEYANHLKNVYNMDVFYGDATLESLIRHSKDIAEELGAFVSMTGQVIVEDDTVNMEDNTIIVEGNNDNNAD